MSPIGFLAMVWMLPTVTAGITVQSIPSNTIIQSQGTIVQPSAFIPQSALVPAEPVFVRPANDCLLSNCVAYDINTQSRCRAVESAPVNDCRWSAGMNLHVDEVLAGGRIAAYRIFWRDNNWSDWYVPGYNDMDYRANIPNNAWEAWSHCHKVNAPWSLRRMWSYFVGHTHMYIICSDN